MLSLWTICFPFIVTLLVTRFSQHGNRLHCSQQVLYMYKQTMNEWPYVAYCLNELETDSYLAIFVYIADSPKIRYSPNISVLPYLAYYFWLKITFWSDLKTVIGRLVLELLVYIKDICWEEYWNKHYLTLHLLCQKLWQYILLYTVRNSLTSLIISHLFRWRKPLCSFMWLTMLQLETRL